jgi:hypothetical protein
VHALAGEHAEVRAVVMRSSTVRISCHMKSASCTRKIFRVQQFQVVQRGLGGEQVEGVQPQAEVGARRRG